MNWRAAGGAPFRMEVTRRTEVDRKGGHLARRLSDGRLLLREVAQCPADDLGSFQDIARHGYFNTNNIWVNLKFLKGLISKDQPVRLPMIVNPKTLDPRDEQSPAVYQVETAMGAAISLFEGASAIIVPRSRFCPVKTTNGLLALRSDRFILEAGGRLRPSPLVKTDKVQIQLDPDFYKNIEEFSRRFSNGAPSLLGCESLTVCGDVTFESNVAINGSVKISNTRNTPAVIPGGTLIEKDISF